MKIILIILVIVIIVGASVYFLSTKNSTEPTKESTEPFVNEITPTTNSIAEQKIHNVAIQSFVFNQKSITIKKGDAVIWTNNDSAPHTVTGDNGGPASQTTNKDKTYSFTFNTIGTFPYHCDFHPSMKGVVIVSE